MGGIGIWCMHFIGNRAVILGDGDPHIQIYYSMAFTGISFALPVCVLLIAFYAVGVEEKAGYIRILMGGILTGSAVCGMHYVGQLGIANYKCSYHVGSVVGSAIIAIFASTSALGIFFRWRATWTDVWWRRGICGCLLAVAVSGMHWTATAGTSYREHDETIRHGTPLSRSQTVIICAVLSCASCVFLSACAIVAGGNRRKSTIRARQLVLSCAFFDPAGRIMVTPQAVLPSRKIVERYVGKTFKDDDLTRTHPAFLWAFRASRNWKLVKDLVPFMKNRLESEEVVVQRHALTQGVGVDKDTELQETNFDTLFKQLFCTTAQELSDELRQPLQDLGMLYDDVLTTTASISRLSRAIGNSLPRKGQLLFTVRQLNKQEAARFAASGFRFATIEHVTSPLSRRIHVPSTALGTHLRDMRDYATTSRNFEQGVHLISFVMRPTIHDHFEVLTAKGVGNPLPSSTLAIKRLRIPHLKFLSHLDGWTISACLEWLISDTARAYHDVEELREQLVQAMIELTKSFPPDIRPMARFSARPLIAPCRGSRLSDEQNCILLPFCVVGSLDTQTPTPDFAFTPFRLFRVQQQVNDGVSDRDGFSKELSQELFYTNIRSTSLTESDLTQSARSMLRLLPSRKQLPSDGPPTASQSRESLVDTSSINEIMVRREVKVDVAKFEETATQSSLGTLSSRTTVVAGEMTATTYVDELYSLCYGPSIRLRPDTMFSHVSGVV
ncbi:hypothetical protein MW887_002378 [Aspergillus wentii]|nr:hypothetical protein MW887_002378 [Aspergillus wentii]